MSILEQLQAIAPQAQAQGNPQVTKTAQINIGDLEEFATKLEEQFPHLEPNINAVRNGGVSPLDEAQPMVPYAVKSRQPKGTATVYYNGKVVLAGALAEFEL